MSKRSEDAAIKAYPEAWILPPIGMGDYHESFDCHAFAREIYKEGYEQAEKDTIERACNWLFSHLPIIVDYYDEDIHEHADRSEFIKSFRTQMEEE